MRVSLKLLSFLWLGLFIIIGGLLYNAYSKLKPDAFVALLTEQVQKNYPGAKLEVGKVSYGFSLDFNLNVENIHLRRSDKLLGSIGEVELRVPWWLLLFNRGNAQINIKNLDVFVDHGQSPEVSKPSADSGSTSEKIEVTLPSYLVDANFTLRAKNISVRDINNARRYFVVSKLLVREFQHGKNSAFEVNIPVSIRQGEQNYPSELWLFGDVTPEPSKWVLNYRGEFRTKENNDKFQIEDLIIGGKATFNPTQLRVSSTFDLSIDKKSVGNGEFKADQEAVFANLNFERLPVSYLSVVYNEIKNPYLPALSGEGKGDVKFHKGFESPTASLSGKIGFDGNFHLSRNNLIPGKWQFSFEDSRWETSFVAPKAEVSFFRRSLLDLKKLTVTQYNEELGFIGFDLASTIGPVQSLKEFIDSPTNVYFSGQVSYKDCSIGEQSFNGSFKYGVGPTQKTYQAELKGADASLEINYQHRALQHMLDVNMLKFHWGPAFAFLAPVFSAKNAIVSGNLQGRWKELWQDGEWITKLNISEASDMSGAIPEFIMKSFAHFEVDSKAIPKQSVQLTVKNGIINVNSLMLEGEESVKISGLLSTQQKSFLTLSYPKNSKVKPLKKEVLGPYWLKKEER